MKSILSRIDYLLLVPASLIVFISFFILSSFQPDLAQSQAMFALVGIGLYFLLQFFHPYDLKTFTQYGYVLFLLILISVYFLGEISHGANSWIPVWGDLRFQPSEFAKPMLVLMLAKILSENPNFSLQFLFRTSFLAGAYFLLVVMQPDLGTASVFVAIWIAILFSSEMSKKVLLSLCVACIVSVTIVGPVVWNVLHDYQRERILVFLDPKRDPLGRGYNALQSIITVGSGGLTGKGFGQGTQSHNKFLPEQYTDFAFATFSEEFGFIGILVLFTLYGILFWRILTIGDKVEGRFAYGICIGVAVIFFFQLFINVGMNTGIMPITGITLPLFSYGGSSLISLFVCLGLVQAVSRKM